MIAWRITKRRYSSPQTVLGGGGAEEVGGRWNPPGLPLIYASENSSLALLETLVQTQVRLLPKSLVIVQIRIPDDVKSRTLHVRDLPKNWKNIGSAECLNIGAEWLRAKRTLILLVPSAVNPLESNVLLNPAHPAIANCSVARPIPIEFDARLISLLRA